MDRPNPLDVQFVDAEDEDRHTSMAVALISVFEGPSPSYDELLAHFGGRLPLVPRRYRQKLRTIPLRLGRPVWVDDPDFDLRYHLRRTALPAPGTDEQLSQLMARGWANGWTVTTRCGNSGWSRGSPGIAGR